ncbi:MULTISPECIES: DEAD/DEAH box helicase family protein [Mesoplasma]|uniref:DNA/RNA helicase n=1 Tax=Mesoplasma florum TaxID=2151 RepID=A0A2R3P784_MESFO|nr:MULTISPECIES: DEAD/DEAH box helicase family protein [Mesoplasma]AVN64360.1 hypothetical protein CG003_01615 [Mesoplasma florum]
MKDKLLQDLLLNINTIDNVEFKEQAKNKSDKWLINQFQNVLEKKLSSFNSFNQKLEFINGLLSNEEKFTEFTNKNKTKNNINCNLSLNELVVSFKDFIEEEFLNANKVLIISPFISSFMVNKLRNWLTNNKNLKVKIITTTFDGSSRFLSLETLVYLEKDFKERIEIRIENSFKNNGSRIHMKAYCFLREGGFSNLYIGSNNFTRTGIMIGNEYSIKISEFREKEIFNNFILEFNQLWKQELIDINNYEVVNKMILSQIFIDEINREKEKEQTEIINNLSNKKNKLELFNYQKDVIEVINQREKKGINKHLIVMATGTGKTITIAKYFEELFYKTSKPLKILFLAHQKEILEQGISTFEKVIPGFKNQVCEFYDQKSKIEDLKLKNYIFATFQSLLKNLNFIQNYNFDLVILDEVHHIEAKSYQKVFDLVSSNTKTLIGLTATPQRTEGIDINKYFNYEYAYELSLYNALSNDLLAPFDYYFIQDKTVDLTGIDLNKIEKLSEILSSEQRNKFVLENIKKMIGINNRDTSTVLFCSSIEHANKLKKFLCENNLRCETLTSENNRIERENIIKKFKNKEINYLCVRDILNEGVDVPNIDRIVFLRPTNSLLIYLQQLGRGLRKTPDKKLQIYDFVNNVDLYVNKQYDPFLLYKAFRKETNIKISELINNNFKIGSFLPAGSELYIDYLTRNDLIEKIRKYESNKKIDNIILEYSKELSYENYKKMFIENQIRNNFTPFKIYSKGKTFIKSNFDFAKVLSRMSINNNKQIISRWTKIVKTKEINLNNLEDKLFMANFCNNKITMNNKEFEKNLLKYWEFIKTRTTVFEELLYLFQFKIESETLIDNDIENYELLSIEYLKDMYVTYDQIYVLLNNGIEKNEFKKNSSVQGIFKASESKYVISASSLTQEKEHKHANYFSDKNKELIWESPDSWKYEDKEKIDLILNKYYVFYQSQETVELFDETIRKYIGNVKSIELRESITNNKENKKEKIRYKFKIS